jgi:hypothetical protein
MPLHVRSVVVVIACLLPRCACEEELVESAPLMAVSPTELDFGVVTVGVEEVAVVQVGNRGSGVLSVDIVVEGDVDFGVQPRTLRVPQGTRQELVVSLGATAEGPRAATIILTSNDADNAVVRVPLRAVGGPPAFAVLPSPIDVGIVNQGQPRTTAFALQSIGMSPVDVLSVAFIDGVGFVASAALPRRLLPQEELGGALVLDVTDDVIARADGQYRVQDTMLVTTSIGVTSVPVLATVNRAPVAIAVEQRTRRSRVKASVQVPLTLDGSESFDPDEGPLAYQWRLIERPSSSSSALVPNADATLTRITMDVIGRYVVELTVTDELGAADVALVELLPRDLTLELTWSADASAACQSLSTDDCAALDDNERQQRCCGQSDLDLHVVAPDGNVGDYGRCPVACANAADCTEVGDEHLDCRSSGLDCSFANRAPEWFAAGRVDDPRLDVDDVRGAGPEIISVDEPVDGSYRLYAHYCLDRIDEPVVATLRIYEEGVLTEVIGPQRLVENDLWTTAVLVRSQGAWSVVAAPDVVDAAPTGLCAQ